MKKTKLFKSLLVAAGLCVGASAWAQTWTFNDNTEVWGADGVTLKGGNQYDENANAVTSGGVTFTGTNGFVSTAKGIGFNDTGSTTDENISIVVPVGYKAQVSVYTASNRTVIGKLGEESQMFNASWASSTKEFSNVEGTEDVTLYLYCNQNPGGDQQNKAPFLESIVLKDMTSVSSYPWKAYAVANISGENTVLKTWSSESDVAEGDMYTIVVDKAIEKDGAIYVLDDEQLAANVFGKTFTMGDAAAVHEFNYVLAEKAVFYGEVENIKTANGSSLQTITGSTVLSNGAGFSVMKTDSYITLTFTVPESAVYSLALGMNNTNDKSRGFNYVIDGAADVSETITVNAGAAYVQNISDVTLKTGVHTLTVNCTYSLTPVFDYLLITKTGEAAKSTFTAKYYNSKGWENVYAYTYNEETLGPWDETQSGTLLSAGEDGLYEVSFEAVFAPEKIIFNNGNSGEGNQTGDLDFVDGAAYNFDGQGDVYNFTFTTNKGWSNAYAYAWSGDGDSKVEQLGAWNETSMGTQLASTEGTFALTFVAKTAPEYIIFHNGAGTQTENLAFENGEAYSFNSSYAVGGDQAVFGSDWDSTDENNQLDENYTLTITGKELAVGTYEYKVVADNDWDNQSYPSSNKEIGIKMAGKYDIIITFDPATKAVTDAMAIYKGISDAGYATYCSPYDLNFEDTEITAYIAKLDGTTISFEEVKNAPANTGLLLKGAENTYKLPMEISNTDVTGNVLEGTLESKTIGAGSFVLMNGGAGVGFYKANSAFTVGANTAYLPATAGARSFIAIDGEATAIEGIATEKAQDGVIYNLQGQRVVKAQKGLYIIDGKKVMVK